MKTPKIFENFKNIIAKIQKMPPKDINTWKTTLIVLTCVDIFGIYWFLRLKALGMALLIVFLLLLAVLLFFSRNNPIPAESQTPKTPPNPPPEDSISNPSKSEELKGGKKQKMPEETEVNEESESEGFGIDLGLGDPKDFQKRIDDALGEPLF